MRVYRTAKGWRIFIIIVALFFIGGGLTMIILSLFVENKRLLWIIIPLFLGLSVIGIAALYDMIKGKFVIADNYVHSISFFSNRQLKHDEIKGFRVNEHYIFIEPISKDKKKVQISRYLKKEYQIIDWLDERYPDLDSIEEKKEKSDFFNNSLFGVTVSEREMNLKKAQQTATILNWVGGLTALWAFFWTKPYYLAIAAGLVVPIFAIIALKLSNGIIRINEKKEGGTHPSIFTAIFFPSCMVGLRGLMDFEIYDYHNLWLPLFGIVAILTAIIIINNQEFDSRKSTTYVAIFGIVLLLGYYVYGGLVVMNTYEDNSKPDIYKAAVLDKRIDTGKYTSYDLELSPWGNRTEVEEVSVAEWLYNQVEKGDSIHIYIKKGRFDIPWIIVGE